MTDKYEELEVRVAALEKLVVSLKLERIARALADTDKKKKAQASKPKKELTPTEKKAVRERLLKGQKDAAARREAEAKAAKPTKPTKAIVKK